MKYDQFLAVLLTALGVMLAAVTLLVGFIALFGYQFIRDEAKRKAAAIAAETADKTVRETREINQATGLSEGQAEEMTDIGPPASEVKTGTRLATSDKGLERDQEDG